MLRRLWIISLSLGLLWALCNPVAPQDADADAEGKYEVLREEKATFPRVGQILEDFSLKDVYGEMVKLSDFRGKKIVVLEFGSYTEPSYFKNISTMHEIIRARRGRAIEFFVIYTREAHAGQRFASFDFAGKKQTKTYKERVDYALEVIDKYSEERTVLIDTFGEECLQKTIGGDMPNALIIVDTNGKVALSQKWAVSLEMRKKIDRMIHSMRNRRSARGNAQASKREDQPAQK